MSTKRQKTQKECKNIDFSQDYVHVEKQLEPHLKRFSSSCDTNISEREREAAILICEYYKKNGFKLEKNNDLFAPSVKVKVNEYFQFNLFSETYHVSMDTFFPHIPLVLEYIAHSRPMVLLPGMGLCSEIKDAFRNRVVMCKNRYVVRLEIELPPLDDRYCNIHKKILKMIDKVIVNQNREVNGTKRADYTIEDFQAETMKIIDLILPETPVFNGLIDAVQFISHKYGFGRRTYPDMLTFAVLKKNWNGVFKQDTVFDDEFAKIAKKEKYVMYEHPVIHLN
jgi:hypothetical protein